MIFKNLLLHRILSLDNAYQEHDYGGYEEKVYEPADIVQTDQSQDPKDKQDDCYGCKHKLF